MQWVKERNDNIPLGDKTTLGLGIYGMDVRTHTSCTGCSDRAASFRTDNVSANRPPLRSTGDNLKTQREWLTCKADAMLPNISRLRICCPI